MDLTSKLCLTPEREQHIEEVVVPLIRTSYYYFINAIAAGTAFIDDEKRYVNELTNQLRANLKQLCEVAIRIDYEEPFKHHLWFQKHGTLPHNEGYYCRIVRTCNNRYEHDNCLYVLRRYTFGVAYMVNVLHSKLQLPDELLQKEKSLHLSSSEKTTNTATTTTTKKTTDTTVAKKRRTSTDKLAFYVDYHEECQSITEKDSQQLSELNLLYTAIKNVDDQRRRRKGY